MLIDITSRIATNKIRRKRDSKRLQGLLIRYLVKYPQIKKRIHMKYPIIPWERISVERLALYQSGKAQNLIKEIRRMKIDIFGCREVQ